MRPGGRRPGTGDHEGGQLWFGRELRLVTESGGPAAIGVGGPGTRNIEFPVDRRVPSRGRVGEVNGYLAVLNASGGDGVLALDTDSVGVFLHVAGLVDHQHRLVVVQMLHHVVTHVVADLVGVPLGPPEQVLHAVRGPVPGPLGDGPAVLARQVRQQAEYQLPGSAPGFDPREPSRYPAHQALERLLPVGKVYAVSCGHRVIFSLHTPMINGGRTRLHSASGSRSVCLPSCVWRTCATWRSLVGPVRRAEVGRTSVGRRRVRDPGDAGRRSGGRRH